MRGFLSFAFLNAIMFADLIRRDSAAGPYCASDQCALTATDQSTHDCAARC